MAGAAAPPAIPGVSAFHTFQPAPAAMIVDLFLREKGFTQEQIQSVEKFVDLPALENRNEASKKVNPQGSIPWFVTTDNQVIAETIAMCEYVEEMTASLASVDWEDCPGAWHRPHVAATYGRALLLSCNLRTSKLVP